MKMRTAWNHKVSLVLMVFTLVVVFCFTVGPTAYAATSISKNATAYVTVDTSLNLRDAPVNGNVIGELYNGDSVTILSDYSFSGYYYVRVDRTGKTGYVYGEYLTPKSQSSNNWNDFDEDCGYDGDNTPVSKLKSPKLENATLVVISSNGTGLYQKSSNSSALVTYLWSSSKLKVLIPTINKGYIYVQDTSGNYGYVSADHVALYGQDDDSTSSDTTGTLVLVSELKNVDLTNATLVVTSGLPLNLRETPNIHGQWIRYLYDDQELRVVSPLITNNYILVEDVSDGKTGYVDIRYVSMYVKENTSPTPPPSTSTPTTCHDCCGTSTDGLIPVRQLQNPNLNNVTLVVISPRQLNMRQAPNQDGKWIKYLVKGDLLTVVSPTITNDYVLVRDQSDNTLGYVHIDYVAIRNSWYESTSCNCCNNCSCKAR